MICEADTFEQFRPLFEERVFCDYFISTIHRNQDKSPRPTGANDFVSHCELTLQEFVERDERGNYKRQEVSAMWHGWCLAIRFSDRIEKVKT